MPGGMSKGFVYRSRVVCWHSCVSCPFFHERQDTSLSDVCLAVCSDKLAFALTLRVCANRQSPAAHSPCGLSATVLTHLFFRCLGSCERTKFVLADVLSQFFVERQHPSAGAFGDMLQKVFKLRQ